MFKSNKTNILVFKRKNNTPLLSSNSKGEKDKTRIKNTKERVILKRNKDINGMEITHGIINKKN
tara:strand:+ start:395 stop:586 length:192 start_codon:yes stop_codon:yes gene_type:complete